VSSALLSVEAVRACERYGPEYGEQARVGLAGVALVPLDDQVLARASTLAPPTLRTLDALHLATALTLGDDLGVLLAYDDRLLEAAEQSGVTAIRPA
jgi:uncharacterized protein